MCKIVLGLPLPVNFQWVMDRPEPVNRVIPPSTTKLKTHALQNPSHAPSYFL